jgi:hypothetical protein
MQTSEGTKVKTVDLTTSLESLSFFLAQTPPENGKIMKPIGKNRRK